jgi:hypothetical protein
MTASEKSASEMQSGPVRESLSRLKNVALGVGILAAVLSLVGLFTDRGQFFQSYLKGYVLWVGVPLGCLAILLIHHLSGGRWGFVVRRFLEAGSRTLLPMAILFIPVIFGMRELYIWARPEAVAADEILQNKQFYLSVPLFLIRAAIYFVVWVGLALLAGGLTRRLDEGVDERLARRFRIISALGLVLYGITVTFASIDWVMSLTPHWFSTIFGPVTGVGQMLSGLAVTLILASWLRRHRPLSTVLQAAQSNDLGNFMLTFVMLWAYMAFSQYLIIWSGNIQEEVPWYLNRMGGGWQTMALALITLHFGVPFLFLLSRKVKRDIAILSKLGIGILFMRFVDIFWIIKPTFTQGGFTLHWLDITLPVALGGIWLAFMAGQLAARSIVAPHDTRVETSAARGLVEHA